MRALGWLLGAAVCLAALRTAAQLGLIILILIIALSLVRAPVESLKVLFGLVLLGTFVTHPGPSLGLMAAVIIVGHWSKNG